MSTAGKLSIYTTFNHITTSTPVSVGLYPQITPASQAHSDQQSVLFLLKVRNRINQSVKKIRTHKFEDLREILQGSYLERGFDQASSKEVQSFHAILSVSNVTSLNTDHTKDGVQNRGLKICIWRQSNGNNCSTRANILGGLLERPFRNCQ